MSQSTSAVEPAARRRLGREERRAAILDGAAAAFARSGYDATSMADIARAAGVSHLIVYRHFESKRELYVAVLGAATAQMRTALEGDGAVGTIGPTPAALLAAARGDEAAFRALWHHAVREPEFAEQVESARALLHEATRGALEPIVAPEHVAWATRATIAYVIEAAIVWVEDGDETLDARWVAATTAALKAGVRSWSRPS